MEVDLNEGIPYPDQRFDTIVCSSVLEHLRRPDLFWKEAFRILAPGGKLILGVPFMYWIHEAPHDYHRFTEYQLQSACEECGLELIAIEVPAGALAIVLDVIGKNIPGRFRRLSKAYQRLAMRFLWSRLGQRIDERNRRHFPIGYFLVAQRPAAASRYSLGSSGT